MSVLVYILPVATLWLFSDSQTCAGREADSSLTMEEQIQTASRLLVLYQATKNACFGRKDLVCLFGSGLLLFLKGQCMQQQLKAITALAENLSQHPHDSPQ